ncbi:DUF1569 domain-containing protein [Flavobacterium humi]|uniref:DUF1569 domain-containing protein n=1 Tax=Flavobacterium humi TaxID=2562683 RepID=A0A4Z0LB92_9FLAO|nr:DUF1569 domain-containing protein [Flavobacterium humi]TGD59057.1 DUF1569 domain-containing protein [Flavobacterium humi]
MASIYNSADNQQIIDRINQLRPDSQPSWGKMSVDQMLSHCIAPIDIALGNKQLKANFLFSLLGRMIKKKIINSPEFKKNSPTAPDFIRSGAYDFDQTKSELIDKFTSFTQGAQVIKTDKHPFFGPMSHQDWDNLQWKHIDHHLKQFGV